jgi:hypothetical protein
MARTMMLTGMDDLAVSNIRHWAESSGLTPSEYLTRLAELHERLNGLVQTRGDEARAAFARQILTESGLIGAQQPSA